MATARPIPARGRARSLGGLDPTTAALITTGVSLLAVALCLNALAMVSQREAVLPALAVGAVAAATMLLRPSWIFPGFVGLTWTSVSAASFGGLPSPIEVGAIVFIGLGLLRAAGRPQLMRDVVLVMLLFFLPFTVAALLSETGQGTQFLFVAFKTLLFVPIVALCVRSVRDAERVVTGLVVTGAVLGAGAISSVLVGPSKFFPLANLDDENQAVRAVGPFGEANFFALSLAILVPFALLLVARGGRYALLGYGSALLLTGGVLAAGSRGGLLTVLFVLIVFGWWSGNRRLRLAAAGVVCGFVVLLPFFAGQASSSGARNVEGRFTENLIAVQMWSDHPVTGVGPGQYPVLYRDYARETGTDPRVLREPHNMVLEIAAEQGTVGLLSWLCIALVLALAVVRSRLTSTLLGKAVVLSIAAYLFGTLFLHGSQIRLLYMLVGLTLGLAAAMTAGRTTSRRAAGPLAAT